MSEELFQLEKLDRRHALHTFFTHRIKIFGGEGASIVKWVEMRNWLWENFGHGLESETVWITKESLGLTDYKVDWAWRIDDNRYYLYFTDSVLTMFTLKYMNT
jgi:hypothetical protein